MNKLTGGLIIAAVALGILAARNARRDTTEKIGMQPIPPSTERPAIGKPKPEDQGIIQRNEPLDNGIAVRSPFNGDPGIVAHARTNGRN